MVVLPSFTFLIYKNMQCPLKSTIFLLLVVQFFQSLCERYSYMGKSQKSCSKAQNFSHDTNKKKKVKSMYTAISADEKDFILRLHRLLGDRWGLIAGRLPWRTREEIENFWENRCNELSYSSDECCSVSSATNKIDQ